MIVSSPGIFAAEVTTWLDDRVPELVPPLRFTTLTGGRSNLTYKVTDAYGTAVVLRRPPVVGAVATAHDMGREHRIISALGSTDVLVPEALAYCDDDAIAGAPFYVMTFVEGRSIATREQAELTFPLRLRRLVSESLVDALAAVHEVDVDAVGLGDLGRRGGYVERQLRRWHGQLGDDPSVPDALHAVHTELAADIPKQGTTTIVHGDFRLDNCLVADDGRVCAVLDWELCTLGDPLADLGMLLAYWADPGEERNEDVLGYPTSAEGFLTRAEVIELYLDRTGRTTDRIDYYLGFGRWKLACILQGVLYRHRAVKGEDEQAVLLAATIEEIAEQAAEALGGIGSDR